MLHHLCTCHVVGWLNRNIFDAAFPVDDYWRLKDQLHKTRVLQSISTMPRQQYVVNHCYKSCCFFLTQLLVVNAMIFEEPQALPKLNNFVRNNIHASLPFQTATHRCVSVEQVLKKVLIFIQQQPHCISVSVFFVSLEIYQRNSIFGLQYLDNLLVHLQLFFRYGIPSHGVIKKDTVGIQMWCYFLLSLVGFFLSMCTS